jgi:NTP pyrophosphatase (non-canonical NTP hydrolase)
MNTFEDWVDDRWDGPVAIKSREWLIATMGLGGESTEVLSALVALLIATGRSTEVLKKHYRDGKLGELKLELGDVLHYLTVIAHSYGWTLDEIARANIAKLRQRDETRAAAGEARVA